MIKNSPENDFMLRLANNKDMKSLFEWANDPATRKWSFMNSKPIDIDEHKNWFDSKLKNKKVRIWIMEKQNIPYGQVRIEKSGNEAVLHYSISSDFRGKNLGRKILEMVIQKTCDEWSRIQIIAFTVPENIASNKSLERAGFKEQSSNKKEKCFIYECN